MLSITSQILLAEHLRLISESELEVELIREVLTEQKQFDPAQAFLSLTHSKTFRTPCSEENLQDFFANNSLPFKTKEVARLMKCYDSDGDLSLSFQEYGFFVFFQFLHFFFSAKNSVSAKKISAFFLIFSLFSIFAVFSIFALFSNFALFSIFAVFSIFSIFAIFALFSIFAFFQFSHFFSAKTHFSSKFPEFHPAIKFRFSAKHLKLLGFLPFRLRFPEL